MTLLQTWLEITAEWAGVFAQKRTAVRAIRLALVCLCPVGGRKVKEEEFPPKPGLLYVRIGAGLKLLRCVLAFGLRDW